MKETSSPLWKRNSPLRDPSGWSFAHPSPETWSISSLPSQEKSLVPTGAASIAAAHVLSDRLFRRVGGSTGPDFMGVLCIASMLWREGREGALVTLICDSGDRYSATYFNDAWIADQKLDIDDWRWRIESFLDTGEGVLLRLFSAPRKRSTRNTAMHASIDGA